MIFTPYEKVEKFEKSSTDGIQNGICHIFSKIDGTNASTWFDGRVRVGGRKRELSDMNDNRKCHWKLTRSEGMRDFHSDNPTLKTMGEWLVPHTIKHYEESAWHKYYVFDVADYNEDGSKCYLTYDEYKPLLEQYGILYIPCIKIVENPTIDELYGYVNYANFLIPEEYHGKGEGIVIKNYDFKNKYGHKIYAKIINRTFDNGSLKIPKVKKPREGIEYDIVNDLVTQFEIQKMIAKILNERNIEEWNQKFNAQLIGCFEYDFITENIWHIVKKYKGPIIDFQVLRNALREKVIELNPDFFCDI